MPGRALLLFDIDGTLLVGDNGAHHAAIVSALEEVFGIDLDGFSFLSLEPWGKTDLQIARDALAAHDVPEERVQAELADWLRAADAMHAQIATNGAHPSPDPAPGADAALETLGQRALLGLLTGNIAGIAHRKLDAAGLGAHFRGAPGGFGSDHADRGVLVRVARERASDDSSHPVERTVVVGDTPRDIACARTGGVRCVAVTTGPFDAAALAGADIVIPTLGQLEAALADLGFGDFAPTASRDAARSEHAHG